MKYTPTGLLRHLRKRLPTIVPVKLIWRDNLPDADIAVCTLLEKRGKPHQFLIELSRSSLGEMPWWVVREYMIHEYAHCLSWTVEHRNLKDHGPMWGVAYAQVYTIGAGAS